MTSLFFTRYRLRATLLALRLYLGARFGRTADLACPFMAGFAHYRCGWFDSCFDACRGRLPNRLRGRFDTYFARHWAFLNAGFKRFGSGLRYGSHDFRRCPFNSLAAEDRELSCLHGCRWSVIAVCSYGRRRDDWYLRLAFPARKCWLRAFLPVPRFGLWICRGHGQRLGSGLRYLPRHFRYCPFASRSGNNRDLRYCRGHGRNIPTIFGYSWRTHDRRAGFALPADISLTGTLLSLLRPSAEVTR